MDITGGLIQYLILVALLTFHEFGHAWTAWKCGDDTARLQGRVSLNPLVHIDPIGTVLLPLIMIFLPGVGHFLIGWAKPVPVNPYNLRRKNLDDILVTMAGPGMNLILSVLLTAAARAAMGFQQPECVDYLLIASELSLLLFFFNLIPVPPLDGSHILRIATNMTWETYMNFARFGFIIVIIMMNIPIVRGLLFAALSITQALLCAAFGVPTG
jgi:Zn-dependent protease